MEPRRPMKILGISGSLQARSSNSALIRAAAEVAPDGVDFATFAGLADLPHFNPDLDGEGPLAPGPVADFRARLGEAQGVLIATPEYAHAAPGVLKNALDWVVGSGELSGKRVALMSASPNHTGGLRAQLNLIPTILVMDAVIVDTLIVAAARKKIDDGGRVVDPRTRARIAGLLRAIAGLDESGQVGREVD